MEFLYHTLDIAWHSYILWAFEILWSLDFENLAAHSSIFESTHGISRHASVIKIHVVYIRFYILVPLVDIEVAHCLTRFCSVSLLEKGHGAFSHGIFALLTSRSLFTHHWPMEALSKGSSKVASSTRRLRPPIEIFYFVKIIARCFLFSRLTFDGSY
jgi:hypothetical protein